MLWPGKAAPLDLDGDIYRNNPLGVKLTVPQGWILSRHTGYPAILALLSHPPSGAEISLCAAATTGRSQLMGSTVRSNATAMRTVGVRVDTARALPNRDDRWKIEALAISHRDGKPRAIRQIYLRSPRRLLFVVTLTSRPADHIALLADHDYVVQSLDFTPKPSSYGATTP